MSFNKQEHTEARSVVGGVIGILVIVVLFLGVATMMVFF